MDTLKTPLDILCLRLYVIALERFCDCVSHVLFLTGMEQFVLIKSRILYASLKFLWNFFKFLNSRALCYGIYDFMSLLSLKEGHKNDLILHE